MQALRWVQSLHFQQPAASSPTGSANSSALHVQTRSPCGLWQSRRRQLCKSIHKVWAQPVITSQTEQLWLLFGPWLLLTPLVLYLLRTIWRRSSEDAFQTHQTQRRNEKGTQAIPLVDVSLSLDLVDLIPEIGLVNLEKRMKKAGKCYSIKACSCSCD